MIKKQNADYKKEIDELKDELKIKIKNLKWAIIGKDHIIDAYKRIQEKENNYINRIKELEKEIEKYKNYFLKPGEKLINIKFTSIDQKINFNTMVKNTENFEKLEASLYQKYPKYKDTENYFFVHGKKLNKHRTLEENKIKDNDILTLGKIDNLQNK